MKSVDHDYDNYDVDSRRILQGKLTEDLIISASAS